MENKVQQSDMKARMRKLPSYMQAVSFSLSFHKRTDTRHVT
jgi:hypothetical protein